MKKNFFEEVTPIDAIYINLLGVSRATYTDSIITPLKRADIEMYLENIAFIVEKLNCELLEMKGKT